MESKNGTPTPVLVLEPPKPKFVFVNKDGTDWVTVHKDDQWPYYPSEFRRLP